MSLSLSKQKHNFLPFFAATVLGGCAAVILPVEDDLITLETVVLAVEVVEGLVAAVEGLDVVGAG